MPHKNVLLVIADDLGKYTGCYGCTSTRTPRIDRLASEGVRFDYAFASTASCSGSRSTLYTGLHTHENGQYGLNIFRTHFQTFPHIDTAPKLFNEAGYRTGIIGKVHVGSDETYPWEHRQESESRDVAWVADQCEAFFASAQQADKPFFLTVGFVDPHRDVTTRGRFGNEGPFDPRVKDLDVTAETVEVPSWLTDLPETRAELVEYYKAIHRADQGLGFILDALAKRGLADDTLVIFTSDNGPPFIDAKTTLYDAGTCLPFIVRAPGCAQGIANPNMVSYIDVLPTLLDFAGIKSKPPSDIVAQPGVGASHSAPIPSPTRLGRSFLSILNSTEVLPESEWQHGVFGSHTFHELQNYWPTRVLRRRRYKYHRNIVWRLDFPFATDLYASLSFEAMRNAADPAMIGGRSFDAYLFRPSEELYDMETDPDELHNLAQDPGHSETLLAMRTELEAWQKKTHDLWLYRDSSSVRALQRYAKDGLTLPDRFDMAASTRGHTMHKVEHVWAV